MSKKIIITSLMNFVLITSCESDNNNQILDPPPSSECFAGQTKGCDNQCAESPMVNDDCGICGGDGLTCDGMWNVYYESSEAMGGFQFKVNNVTILNASGGAASTAGFSISSSSSSATILGFSMSGSTIAAGSGVLLNLELSGSDNSTCISDLIISDVSGVSISGSIENCNTIKF